MNKTNISLRELKDESKHYCDLTYMYLMFLFENDKKLVDSICFKMSYSVVLIEKIVDIDTIRLTFENKVKFSENVVSNIAFSEEDHFVLIVSNQYK
jgi:hypothetical protein